MVKRSKSARCYLLTAGHITIAGQINALGISAALGNVQFGNWQTIKVKHHIRCLYKNYCIRD